MRKLIFIASGLFALGIVPIIWLYGPNYLLPLPDTPVIEKTAIQMPVDKFFYVRKDSAVAAIKIIRLTWNKGAIYECYYQSDGTGDFKSKSVVYKKGKVYENYAEVSTSPSSLFLKDKGGTLNVKCGQIIIEWSNQNWIYFKGYSIDHPLFEIAPTMISDIAQVNVKDENLKWFPSDTRDKFHKNGRNLGEP